MNSKLVKSIALILPALLSILNSGCSGGGGVSGMSISGGSVPLGGGGTVTGNIVMPSGQPVTNANVSVITASSNTSIQANSVIDSKGNFTVTTSSPINDDIIITFTSDTKTFKTVVPSSSFTQSQSIHIGTVNAFTTIVASAIIKEIGLKINAPSMIISGQQSYLNGSVPHAAGLPQQQLAALTDPIALKISTNRLLIDTANAELTSLSANLNETMANTALDGTLGYISATGGSVSALTANQRKILVSNQVAQISHSSNDIATALIDSGVTADPTLVDDADNYQRTNLNAFYNFNGLTPYEAIVIAACPANAGGFSLDQTHMDQFINKIAK